MLTPLIRRVAPLLLIAGAAPAQQTGGAEVAVLSRKERHHRVLDEDKLLRVMRVVVRPRDSAKLHAHDLDHFWIAIGPSDIVDSVPDAPAVRVVSANLAVHFEAAGRSHVMRNAGDASFENFTVEFLDAQTNVRNLCGEAIAAAPKSCPTALVSPAAGIRQHLAFDTDQFQVSVMSFGPGATLRGQDTQARPWFVAWDDNARRGLRLPGAPVSANPSGTQDGRDWGYGAWRPSAQRDWFVTNSSTVPLLALVITPKAP